jgi:hypothetical protein
MQTVTTLKSAKSAWLTFLPAWVLANVAGWALLSLAAFQPFGWVIMSALLLIAFAISGLQWLCLRFFFDADRGWLLASTLAYGGYLLAINIYLWICAARDEPATMPGLLAAGLAALFALSWLQRGVLRKWMHHATSWVGVSPLAAALAFYLMWALTDALQWSLGVQGNAAFGAVYGAATGALLAALRFSPHSTPLPIFCTKVEPRDGGQEHGGVNP